MSRVTRRAGTKSLTCPECARQVKGKQGTSPRTVMTFRGKSRARLRRHLAEVHGPARRQIRREEP